MKFFKKIKVIISLLIILSSVLSTSNVFAYEDAKYYQDDNLFVYDVIGESGHVEDKIPPIHGPNPDMNIDERVYEPFGKFVGSIVSKKVVFPKTREKSFVLAGRRVISFKGELSKEEIDNTQIYLFNDNFHKVDIDREVVTYRPNMGPRAGEVYTAIILTPKERLDSEKSYLLMATTNNFRTVYFKSFYVEDFRSPDNIKEDEDESVVDTIE